MKRELFFLVLLVLGIILWMETCQAKESFQNADPTLNVPRTRPDPENLAAGDPKPFAPPSGKQLAPPPGQMASVNSYPATDPALEKVPTNRLKMIHESLVGFLTNEAPGLEKLNDPSVQLPLQTTRADVRRVEDELSVLDRNPGIESSLTQEDANQIEANVAFLQKKWRFSANNMQATEGFQSRVYGPAEGFQNDSTGATGSTGSTGPADFSNTVVPASVDSGPGPGMGSGPSSIGSTGSTGPIGSAKPKPASLFELRDLVVRISAEIVRLQTYGAGDDEEGFQNMSMDPVIQQRIALLQATLAGINDIIKKVENGQMKESDIPITEEAYFRFLPVLVNTNAPLPNLLQGAGINSIMNSLFPLYGSGDATGANLAQSIFSKYVGNFLKNMSWNLNLEYVGESERKIAQTLANNIGKSQFGLPPMSENSSEPRGMFESVIKSLNPGANAPGSAGAATSATSGGSSTSGSSSHNTGAPTNTMGPQRLNWKDRSQEICDQIEKRGLNSYDYGCMKNTDDVGENFSFRGYARMVCNRLATNYDPSIPTLCGCPPPTWPGWRP